MNNIFLEEISEVIYCAIVNPEITIAELSSKTDIPREVVRNILMYFYEYPIGRLIISYEGISKNHDIYELDDAFVDEFATWKIDISQMDKIPVENLDEEEAFVLVSLLQGLQDKEIQGINGLIKRECRNSYIATKGTSFNLNMIFKFKYYSEIKKALMRRQAICANYDGVERELVLFPIGLVYNSQKESWYIVCRDKNNAILPYDIEKLSNLHLGDCFAYDKGFKLKEYLMRFFSMEQDTPELVEVLFKNEANVIDKVKRRLGNMGSFERLEDGSMVFRGELIGLKDFKRWVMGFGSSAILREPKWLRDDILEEYRQIVSMKS
ncbi:MAG: helix-turn-helix transcriptional regulator [Bacillota bacterium]